MTEKATREEFPAGYDPAAEPALNAINRPKDLKFSITDCKLYVPVVTLQTEYQNQLYKFNRLFVLAFPNEEDRDLFSKYYAPTVEIKDYNVIIDGEQFYEIPIKNKEEAYKAIIELIGNDLLRTRNEFHFEYFCEY